MRTIQQDVLDVLVYDKEGNFLTDLNYNKKVELLLGKNGGSYFLTVKDATQNMNMLELLGEKIASSYKTDFDKEVDGENEVKTIRFNKKPKQEHLKIVAKGFEYNIDTAEIEHEIRLIFPSVKLTQGNDLEFEHGKVYNPIYSFQVLPFNDNGDLYDIQFKKVK